MRKLESANRTFYTSVHLVERTVVPLARQISSTDVPPMSRLPFLIGTASLLLVLTANLLTAQTTTTWIGGDGDFREAANWSGGVVPSGPAANPLIDGDPNTNSTVTASSVWLGGLTIDAGDTLQSGDSGLRWLGFASDDSVPGSGNVVNRGLINLRTGASLLIAGDVTFSGGGTVRLSDRPVNQDPFGNIFRSKNFDDTPVPSTLINADNTFAGSGGISPLGNSGDFSIINQFGGVFDANIAGPADSLDHSLIMYSENQIVNQGVFRASNNGMLVLLAEAGLDNSGGTIEAIDGGLITNLNENLNLHGGTLRTRTNGRIELTGFTALTDTQIDGSVDIRRGGKINGQIQNSGTLNIGPAPGSNANVSVSSDRFTLSGGGSVNLVRNGKLRTGLGLINVDNQIRGHGVVSGVIQNEAAGQIDANSDGETLQVYSQNAQPIQNRGVMTATNGGTLLIGIDPQTPTFGFGVVDNRGGLIEARDGSVVTVSDGFLHGGSLQSVDSGTIEIKGQAFVDDLNLSGKIDNRGRVAISEFIDPMDSASVITITGPTSLQGGGTVELGALNVDSRIISAPQTQHVLTNIDNTIEGTGQIGEGSLVLINRADGIIHANDTATMIIDATTTNEGTVVVDAAATMRISGEFTNAATGMLAGNGMLVSNTIILNEGRIAPGSSVGELTFEASLEFRDSAELEIEIDPTGADLLTVIGGDVFLNGSLVIDLEVGFVPEETEIFDILTLLPDGIGTGTLSGMFTGIADGDRVLTSDGFGSFQVDYDYQSGIVQLSDFAVTIPEPTGGAAVLISLVAISAGRRRRL